MENRCHTEITGELRDTETVMRSSEGGDWKSTIKVTRWSPTLLQVRFGGGVKKRAAR